MVQILDKGITRPLELAAEKSGGVTLVPMTCLAHRKIVKPCLQLASK